MLAPEVTGFADALDRQIELQEGLLQLVATARTALAGRDATALADVTRRTEIQLHALGVAEQTRQQAVARLAAELGVEATRWSEIAPELDDDEYDHIEPRVEALTRVVRRLEMSNAINTRLAVQDLERVDHTIRTLGMIDSPTYGTAGGEARIPGGVPIMLNTSA